MLNATFAGTPLQFDNSHIAPGICSLALAVPQSLDVDYALFMTRDLVVILTFERWAIKSLSNMTSRYHSLLFFFIVLALCAVHSYAQTQSPDAARQVTSGRIKVNGQEVPPGFAVPPDSLVEAGQNSSAVVSLGKLGRVEVLPNSKMKITYDDLTISIALESGGARVFKSQGASARVTTKNGDVIANTPLAATFTVDTECGNTAVAAHFATVELRSGKAVRTISPGAEGTSGEPRTDCKPRTKLKGRIKSN